VRRQKAVESLGYRVDAKNGAIYDGQGRSPAWARAKPCSTTSLPAATFIAYNYNTPVDVAAFERERQAHPGCEVEARSAAGCTRLPILIQF
jgi:hypothetical protein